jgi:hypothetical protein
MKNISVVTLLFVLVGLMLVSSQGPAVPAEENAYNQPSN